MDREINIMVVAGIQTTQGRGTMLEQIKWSQVHENINIIVHRCINIVHRCIRISTNLLPLDRITLCPLAPVTFHASFTSLICITDGGDRGLEIPITRYAG